VGALPAQGVIGQKIRAGTAGKENYPILGFENLFSFFKKSPTFAALPIAIGIDGNVIGPIAQLVRAPDS
jgi:hypothetical protein